MKIKNSVKEELLNYMLQNVSADSTTYADDVFNIITQRPYISYHYEGIEFMKRHELDILDILNDIVAEDPNTTINYDYQNIVNDYITLVCYELQNDFNTGLQDIFCNKFGRVVIDPIETELKKNIDAVRNLLRDMYYNNAEPLPF